MNGNHDRWITAALAPAREIEPTDAEIAPALVRIAAAQIPHHNWNPRRNWRRIVTLSRRTLIIAAAMVLLIAAAAIATGLIEVPTGDDQPDEETNSSSVVRKPDGRGTNPPPATDEGTITLLGNRERARAGSRAITEMYDGLRDAIEAGVTSTDQGVGDLLAEADEIDGLARACDLMSAKAQRQTIVYISRSAGIANVKWTCEKAMALQLRQTGENDPQILKQTRKPTIVGVNAGSRRAIVTVRARDKNSPLTTIELVREDDEWKLAATPSGGD